MNLEIGNKVRITNLDSAPEVFECVPEKRAPEYYKRRTGSKKKTGLLSGIINLASRVFYVQMEDGYLAPYHENELELVV